ncbi:MAG: hypothetical protein JWQ19_47 [Subtercola sp.]|nr:hypothetical protein [Subtercola sp.]
MLCTDSFGASGRELVEGKHGGMTSTHPAYADLLLARGIDDSDSDGEERGRLRRAAASGRLLRLRRGVYVDSERWAGATPGERYRQRIRAVVASREVRCVVAYHSAAALWSLPRLGAWPDEVHLKALPDTKPTSRNGVRWHTDQLLPSDVVQLNGVFVTSRVRTLVDLARVEPFAQAVIALDHALNSRSSRPYPALTQHALIGELARTRSRRGAARATRAIEFCSASAASVGETYSRVLMRRLGFSPPQLQLEHNNPRGGRYFTDFEWHGERIVGEFDGVSKYLKPEYLEGSSSGDAVVREKIREDDLRAEGFTVVRWLWRDLHAPDRFAQILTRAGVPRSSLGPRPARMAQTDSST